MYEAVISSGLVSAYGSVQGREPDYTTWKVATGQGFFYIDQFSIEFPLSF